MRIVFLFLYCVLTYLSVDAQPELKIRPHDIEFEDIFSRFEKVYLINEGDQTLRIDSIVYRKPELYYFRFDNYNRFPLEIAPGDTVGMDCILSGYFYLTVTDTADTVLFYNNGEEPVEELRIKIDFFNDDFSKGTLSGNINFEGLPVAGSRVYFFYEGNYLIGAANTDIYGNYSVPLPPGNYLVSAEKDSFYLSYFGQAFDPFNAQYVRVSKDSSSRADIELIPLMGTNLSISGKINDNLSNGILNKGIVIVRKGTHTPNKISGDSLNSRVYATMIKYDGTYKFNGVPSSGYYFVQSFSDFYIPAYYKSTGISPVFWQEADSIFIDSNHVNRNIGMTRDSSTGGGSISGVINTLTSRIVSEDVIVYAKSLDFNQPFTYALSRYGNSFNVQNLPYGNYGLIGQRVGDDDVYSDTIRISPTSTSVTGVALNFTTSVNDYFPSNPDNYELMQNYPNPFNPSTSISFYLPKQEMVSLKIFNILGQEVAAVTNELLNSGHYRVEFNASGLASGVYLYSIKAGEFTASKKMLILK